MSHEPTHQEYTAAIQALLDHKRTVSELPISAILTAANTLRDKRIRNEALEEAATALASRMELYRQKAAKRDPYASDCANLHDLSIAHLEATEYAYDAIRALKDKEPNYE